MTGKKSSKISVIFRYAVLTVLLGGFALCVFYVTLREQWDTELPTEYQDSVMPPLYVPPMDVLPETQAVTSIHTETTPAETVPPTTQTDETTETQAAETWFGQLSSVPVMTTPSGERVQVALTFDDGPCQDTARLLDILLERDVKAAFFVLGRDRKSVV